MENIKFKTKSIAKYYMENRQYGDEFYLSEKKIMSSAMDRFENAFITKFVLGLWHYKKCGGGYSENET